MTTRTQRAYLDAIKAHGAEVLGWRNNRHLVVRARYRGEEFQTVFAASPSDRKAYLNWASNLRRMLADIDRRHQSSTRKEP